MIICIFSVREFVLFSCTSHLISWIYGDSYSQAYEKGLMIAVIPFTSKVILSHQFRVCHISL